jgi:outer membrane protein OmpA-like peptidoglycan-associated protein
MASGMRGNSSFMHGTVAVLCFAATFGFAATLGWSQSPQTPASSLTGRSIQAIGYRVNGGSTRVNFKNTGLMPQVAGDAKVDAKPGVTKVEVNLTGLSAPMKLGAEFLAYVLWAVSPDGRAINLGGIPFDNNGNGELKATTQLQSFSLFVTAEPYSAVRQPSEVVILENEVLKNTKGKIFVVDDYKLMKRSEYEKLGNPLALGMDLKNVPREMYEARNAVEIAKSRGADKYAPEVYTKADASLKMAENALASKANKKDIISTARQASQFAEDARALCAERKEQERIANERAAAAAKAKSEAEAKAAAEAAEAQRKADEEARRQAELAAAREAQLKAEAAAKESQMKAEAAIAAAKAKAEADALAAKEAAAKAEAERARQDKEVLRAQLLEQFNRVLETRDSPRGLVITMADVLFDTGKFDLRSEAREALARLSGIVVSHPGLYLQVEGHTDSVGSEDFNQKLSDQRADAVRDYLVHQGIEGQTVTAKGFGKTMPIAENDTAAGRQKNRRVELIVSGEVIGVKIGK